MKVIIISQEYVVANVMGVPAKIGGGGTHVDDTREISL